MALDPPSASFAPPLAGGMAAPSPTLLRAAAHLLELEWRFQAAAGDDARNALHPRIEEATLRLAREPGFGPGDAALKLQALTRRLRLDLPADAPDQVTTYLLADGALAALAALAPFPPPLSADGPCPPASPRP